MHFQVPKCPKCRAPLNPKIIPCPVPDFVDPNAANKQRNLYSCPFCVGGLHSRIELIAHVESAHIGDSANCPICEAMPWVSTRAVRVLSDHLAASHPYDHELFGEYVNMDERMVLETALRLSMQEYLV